MVSIIEPRGRASREVTFVFHVNRCHNNNNIILNIL